MIKAVKRRPGEIDKAVKSLGWLHEMAPSNNQIISKRPAYKAKLVGVSAPANMLLASIVRLIEWKKHDMADKA